MMLAVAEESFQPEEHPKLNAEDHTDEADETLSFCDFAVNGDNTPAAGGDWQNFSRSSSTSSSSEVYFEFSFGEDRLIRSSNTFSYPAENIMFFGKLISSNYASKQPETNNKQSVPKKIGIKAESGRTMISENREEKLKSMSSYKKMKMAIKSRWYMMFFGLVRFPAEMELSDMKKRQKSRHGRRPEKEKARKNRSAGTGKGKWGLIGALGCGGAMAVTTSQKPW